MRVIAPKERAGVMLANLAHLKVDLEVPQEEAPEAEVLHLLVEALLLRNLLNHR